MQEPATPPDSQPDASTPAASTPAASTLDAAPPAAPPRRGPKLSHLLLAVAAVVLALVIARSVTTPVKDSASLARQCSQTCQAKGKNARLVREDGGVRRAPGEKPAQENWTCQCE